VSSAQEIVRQVLRGEWRCPSNTLPMYREVTSNPATAEKAARDVVEALEAEGLLSKGASS
jgi:DNA-binding FadR family transcriptional regulator